VEKIVQGEDDYEHWQQQVIGTATEAEAARRYCIESPQNGPLRDDLVHLMEKFGKQAKKLEVIGERQEYPTEEVEMVSELAQICSSYATVGKGQSLSPEENISDNLPPVVDKIFSFVK